MFCRLLERLCRCIRRLCTGSGSGSSGTPVPRPPGTVRPPQPYFAIYLRDVSGIPYDDRQLAALGPRVFGSFADKLSAEFGNGEPLRLRTAFKGDLAALRALVRRATANADRVGVRGFVPLDIEHYFVLRLPPNPRRPAFDLLCDLKEWARTLGGYVYVSEPTRPAVPSSGYLDPATRGTGVSAVQGAPHNLDGNGQFLVNIERGWCPRPNVQPLPIAGLVESLTEADVTHSVATASVILGGRAGSIVGIAPKVVFQKALCLDPQSFVPDELVAAAILGAGAWLDQNKPQGRGVILIEQASGNFRPLESDPWVFAAIQNVVAAGHVVIEPAGTQPEPAQLGEDWINTMVGQYFELDNSTSPPGRVVQSRPLDRTAGPDCGAIVVAGGIPEGPDAHQRHPLSNYGNLVDCWAWGESIACEGIRSIPDPTDPTRDTWVVDADMDYEYGGTSGASAIIAGVVVLMQQARQNANQLPLTALQIRDLFNKHGTPGLGELTGKNMPDLAPILADLPNIPDIVIIKPDVIG